MRPTIHATMLEIARVLARRATCYKLQVGCVLTDARGRIIGAGYNGLPSGMAHCIDSKCVGVCWATHAESSALLSCRDLSSVYTCYVTHSPCMSCAKQLASVNCKEIVFLEQSDEAAIAAPFWKAAGHMWLKYTL
jgi:dCMP deaminase